MTTILKELFNLFLRYSVYKYCQNFLQNIVGEISQHNPLSHGIFLSYVVDDVKKIVFIICVSTNSQNGFHHTCCIELYIWVSCSDNPL